MKEHTVNAPQSEELIQYHLKTEPVSDEYGAAVMLTQQDGIDDPVTIMVHPWQLRAACQHLGILHTDPEAERAAARLARRLKVLAERINQLNDHIQAHRGTEHVGLRFEQAYAQATADLAAEFMHDMANEASRPTAPVQGELL